MTKQSKTLRLGIYLHDLIKKIKCSACNLTKALVFGIILGPLAHTNNPTLIHNLTNIYKYFRVKLNFVQL